jgi:hypothetical protein
MQFNAFFIFILLFFLDTGSHYVTQAGFELTILLPQPLNEFLHVYRPV